VTEVGRQRKRVKRPQTGDDERVEKTQKRFKKFISHPNKTRNFDQHFSTLHKRRKRFSNKIRMVMMMMMMMVVVA